MVPAERSPTGDLTVIGLLGGVGSGKSTVARALARQGALVIDADRIAREVMGTEEVLAELRREIPPGVIDEDGRVDRARLGRLAFDDEGVRRLLNRVIHPRVRARVRAILETVRQSGKAPVIVFDIPLLLESELDRLVTCHLFVDAPEALRRERLVSQRGWEADELERRERTQVALAEKRRRADFIVSNTGGLDQLCREVESLWPVLTRERDGGRTDRYRSDGDPSTEEPTR